MAGNEKVRRWWGNRGSGCGKFIWEAKSCVEECQEGETDRERVEQRFREKCFQDWRSLCVWFKGKPVRRKKEQGCALWRSRSQRRGSLAWTGQVGTGGAEGDYLLHVSRGWEWAEQLEQSSYPAPGVLHLSLSLEVLIPWVGITCIYSEEMETQRDC